MYQIIVEILFSQEKGQKQKTVRETAQEFPTTDEIEEIEQRYERMYTDPYSVSERDKGFQSATVVNIFKTKD